MTKNTKTVNTYLIHNWCFGSFIGLSQKTKNSASGHPKEINKCNKIHRSKSCKI